jgi:transglutaminase-like putative cysteine protease
MTDKFIKIIPVFFAVFLFSVSCDFKVPQITSIDPKIGRMGEVITLTGINFGEPRGESYVTIAGITPTSSSYYLWQDDMIMVRVPELGESGLVYVHTDGKRSNGVLFSNTLTVPRPIEGEELGLDPRITSVTPQTGAPGTVITIIGNNFGASRAAGIFSGGSSGVFFTWDYESPSYNVNIVREPEFIEVSEAELGYELWNSREIRIRMPDGARSGNMEIRTPHGRSRPVFFDVTGKPGTKNFTEKRSYTVNYSVDIRVIEATRPNNLFLWMPLPVTSPSQRNVTLVSRSTEPFLENHRGVSLFKLENLASGTNQSINLSFRVEVYAVETGIRPLSVRQDSSPLAALYTQSSALVPNNDPQVRSAANDIVGREQNPYLKAKAIYDWITSYIRIIEVMPYSSNNILTAIDQKQADAYTAALLYATLARAAGIPCIPAAGVLIDQNGQTFRHYWAEVWLNDFGWLPVDPVLGAGAAPSSFTVKEDNLNYYFGNIDNQRITFSRGELLLSQMESRGRLVSHAQSFSLQNIWEEASGGLDSYTSLWGNITISGIYTQ